MSRRPLPSPVSSDRWRLEDEREFLVRSLDDAELEHRAGDLSTGDFEALRRRDRSRLAEVEASLAALEPAPGVEHAGTEQAAGAPSPADAGESPAAPPRRQRRRWWLVVVGVGAIAAGAVLLVLRLLAPQLPGQSISGSVDLNASQQIEQELAQATVLANEGTKASITRALAVYQQVLADEPNQPQALAEMGWLEWQAGAADDKPSLVIEGKAMVQRSLKVKPYDYAARFFLGTILLKQGDAAGAVVQYRAFLAEGPPAREVTTAAPLVRQAFTAARLPLPPGVPAA